MSNRGHTETVAVLEALNFSQSKMVVDVGGGNGGFLSAILAQRSTSASIRSAMGDQLGKGGQVLLPRCNLVAGDFFDGVPPDGDTYILKRILFDWTEEEALRILKNCRRAMNGDARLLIIEPLIGPPNEQCPAHLYDMTFLVMMHGRLRTADEYSALLGEAGFQLQRVVPTESDVSIVEAFV